MLAASPMLTSSTKRRDLELNTHRSDKFDQNDIVVDAMGNVLSGSPEALIARLLPTRDGVPDTNYMFTLLLNLRTVMSPEELMQKIVQVGRDTLVTKHSAQLISISFPVPRLLNASLRRIRVK
ncbi:hypothetical protein Aduo_013054 [Ancylostoma duodenale]